MVSYWNGLCSQFSSGKTTDEVTVIPAVSSAIPESSNEPIMPEVLSSPHNGETPPAALDDNKLADFFMEEI